MSKALTARSFAVAAALGMTAAAPASAQPAKAPKPVTVVMPAHAVSDPAQRICMPRTTAPGRENKTLPKTICQPRDAWAAMGVIILAK